MWLKVAKLFGLALFATNPPAEYLCDRQNLSITVPHRHCRGFAAAQTTQEGVGSFLLVCYFPFLCQVCLRPGPARAFSIASFSLAYHTAGLANLFVFFLLVAGGDRETDSLHTMDLHKRQVKLKYRKNKYWVSHCETVNVQQWCHDATCPHLVLCTCVPVEVLEESQRVGIPHKDEIPCSVCQVGRG